MGPSYVATNIYENIINTLSESDMLRLNNYLELLLCIVNINRLQQNLSKIVLGVADHSI